MSNRIYLKEGMQFEGITMQEGKASSLLKFIGFIVVTALLLGLLIIFAGNFFSSNNTSSSPTQSVTILPTSSRRIEITETPTPIASPTAEVSVTSSAKKATPTATPAKLVSPTASAVSAEKSDLKVEVLNGSGKKGVAKSMSSVLTNAGYTVTRTGNADAYTYKGVVITMKNSKASFLNTLKKDIVQGGYIVSSSATTLPETAAVDASVIVGAE